MSDMLSLIDPRNAQAFLKGLPVATRRKGESLFHMGKVGEIFVESPGAFSMDVLDGESYNVNLRYAALGGWTGECSCDKELDCELVFAGMSSLLAEHRTSIVRNLSSNSPKAAAALAASRPKQGNEPKGDLARLLALAAGRNLKPEESRFIAKI